MSPQPISTGDNRVPPKPLPARGRRLAHRLAPAFGAALLLLGTWPAVAQPTFSASGQPKDFSVSVGANVTNQVTATGTTGAVTYQWWFNDGPLDGATNRRLTLLNVQPAQAGNYFAVAADTMGAVTSRVAKLEVDTTFTKITTGPIATDRNIVFEGSAVDYDRDGDLDLLAPGVGSGRSAFYRNDGGGTFTRLTDTNALPFLTPKDAAVAAWGDYDNDGFPDLALMAEYNYSTTKCNGWLYRNNGNGTFSPGTVIEPNYAWTAAWGDYDHDGFLDLLVPQYGTRAALLLHNDGRGGFTKATTNEVGALAERIITASAPAWADYDDDGWLDALIRAWDKDMLFRNLGAGRFERDRDSGVRTNALGPFAGVWGDYDNDGRLDLLIANLSPGTSGSLATLYRNKGEGRFEDVTATAVPRLEGDANSVSSADYDNDGYLDAYLTVANELLHNNGDGTFTRIAAGSPVNDTLPSPSGSVSSQWFDFDNDGFLDLFVSCGSDYGAGGLVPSFLYRNNGNPNRWLKVRLVGTASNRMGAGAKVRIKTTVAGKELWQRRDTTAGGVYNGNQPEAHFGLGLASKVDLLRVEWPSGNVQEMTDVAANQVLQLTEVTGFVPVRPVVTINGTVTVTSSAVGTGYQWYFGGAALEGRTTRTLTVSKAQRAQAGRYTLVAHTDTGPRTNHVYVRVDTQFTKVLEGEIVTESSASIVGLWFDWDHDGRLDLHVANNSQTPKDTLLHNEGDGRFTTLLDSPVVKRPGVPSFAATAVDIDQDGDQDLFVLRGGYGTDTLFRNDGAGVFVPVTNLAISRSPGENTDAAWADYDRDGDLDLLLAKGLNASAKVALFRNNNDGTFSAVTAAEAGGWLLEGVTAWICNWADYDADGWPDALVQPTTGQLRLYHNDGNGRLSRVGGTSLDLASDIGASWGDYDNDGYPDLLTGAWLVNRPSLHRNLAGKSFADVTRAAGLNLPAQGIPAWGDYDNDGFLDFFSTGGGKPGVLYRNRGDGTFQAVEAGNLLTDGVLRNTAVWVDYDNNGFLDLFVACGDYQAHPNQLFRNNGNGNHWLKFGLSGAIPNRNGIGAKLRVRATIGGRTLWQLREISGNSAVHGVPLLAHFGLGDATKAATVRVEWPSGTVQELTNVAADQFLTITEPAILKLAATAVADGIRIQWRGDPNATYTLQSSSSMAVWNKAQTVTTDSTGLATATSGMGTGPLFFRVVKE